MPEIGERFMGTVVKTTTFGAFVSLLPGKDGLLHVTQIRKLHGGKRIENVEDVINVGDKIQVEIREIDDRGKLSLVPVEVDRARGGRRGPRRRRVVERRRPSARGPSAPRPRRGRRRRRRPHPAALARRAARLAASS